MPKLSVEKWEAEHRKHVKEYINEIDALYQQATDELVSLGMTYAYDPTSGRIFTFSSEKLRGKAATEVTAMFSRRLRSIIFSGITTEWAFANEKTDSWVKKLFSEPKEGYMLHNIEAMEAYQRRRIYGHTLSDRVWDYSKQHQEQIELALSVGLTEGRSATAISRDIRHLLKDPDKLFRRVRDQFGDLQLSKAAQAYHPGQGVYRSSYQNAIRLARTEINGAYREADHTRWNQLDFIVGVEIKPSKSHEAWLAKDWVPRFKKSTIIPEEICDTMAGRYPKDFKFIGWHPNCRCYAVPILANEGIEGADWWDNPQNEVTTTPKKYKDWIADNKDRIENAQKHGKLPYFLSENRRYLNIRPERTEAQKQAIISKWQARQEKYKKATTLAANILNVAKNYPEVDASRLQELYDNYRINKMRTEAARVANRILAAKQDDMFLSKYIPDVRDWKKQFTSAELHEVYDAVEKKITGIKGKALATHKYSTHLEQELADFEFEIKYVADPTKYKPGAIQYKTWKVSQAAYAKQHALVLDAIDWENINIELASITSFKTKSKPYLGLVDTLQEAISKNDKSLAQKTILDIKAKRAELDKAAMARQRKKMGNIKPTNLPDMSKDEIDRLLDLFNNETMDDADKRLRPLAEQAWATLTDEEKLILTKYTQTFCYLNEPLRGLPYFGSLIPNADHIHDLPILTSALEKFKMPQNTVVRRGVNNYAIPELGYDLSSLKVGDVFTDKGFLSTAVHRNKGFHQDYNLVICVPKGAKGFYAEPLSHYTDYCRFDYKTKTLWDGKSVETIGGEAEWIGQRGSQFKVLKKSGKTIYLQMIGQLQ